MTKALGDILANKWEEPPEILIIKEYVRKHFQELVSVGIQDKQIIIKVSSAALASSLRMHLHKLQQLTQTDKRLIIRIGS